MEFCEVYNGDLKSKQRYDSEVSKFKEFAAKQGKSETESTVLEYLMEKSKDYAASSLWTYFSMLNNYFKLTKNVKLNDSPLIIDFLKRKEKGHVVKKSAVFDSDNIKTFLEKADSSWLMEKAAVVTAVSGLMRISELISLMCNDITIDGDNCRVFIKQSKTDQAGKGFYFLITMPHAQYMKNYLQCFPSCTGRLFRKIDATGKITNRPIGKNSLAKIPSRIAQFLELDNPENYTGHCFRRTGATILADSGSSESTLKRAGRWSSAKVVDGYLDDGKKLKLGIANVISNSTAAKETDTSNSKVQNITFTNCSNIVFNC